MVAMASEYENLVNLIDEIEKAYQRKEFNYVNVSETMEAAPQTKAKKYGEVVGMIEGIESGRRPKEVTEKREPGVEPHLLTTGVAQAQYAQPQAAPPQGAPAPPAAPPKKAAIAKELSAIAGKLGKKQQPAGRIQRKRINVKELVLPSLSIADQISELERVIEGMRENVFDEDHLAIVSEEVFGLEQVVRAQKKAQKIKLNSLEQSLWDLRDQRIADAITLLRQRGAG